MNYPIEILPSINKKIISCDISSHFLIRSTPTNTITKLRDEITGEVSQQAICSPRENIIDLSTSLLGVFDFSHNLLELTPEGRSKYSHYCDPDINVTAPIYNLDFQINSAKGFFVILIEKIAKISVCYTIGEYPIIKSNAICSVVHTPTLWNYWHYSIKWFLQDYNCYLDAIKDEKLKRKIAKRLSGEARALIARFASVNQPNYQELSKSCYLK